MKFSIISALTFAATALASPLKIDSKVYDKEIGIRALEAVLFPHYLNPVRQATPNTAYPTQFTGEVAFTSEAHLNETRLLVGFDVPANVGTRCAIKFQLPPNVPGGYQWSVTGSGRLDVWSLEREFVNGVSTWNNRPNKTTQWPQFQITQPLAGGVAQVAGTVIPCLGGRRQDFEIAITRPGPASFNWFELDNPVHGVTLNIYT